MAPGTRTRCGQRRRCGGYGAAPCHSAVLSQLLRRPLSRLALPTVAAARSGGATPRLPPAAKRYYAAQLGHIDGMPGMGMEEVEMDMEDEGDMEMEMALKLGDATWPEVACPHCYEDHDVASLCVHLEEDHPYEPHPVDPK